METMTVGGATSGNWAIGRVLIPSTPRKRRIMEITIASAGRWRILVHMAASEARYLRRSIRGAVAIPRGISFAQRLLRGDDLRIPPCRRREPVGFPRERSFRPRQSPA